MGSKHTMADLLQMQSLPLEAKITASIRRIIDWHDYWDGDVAVSFSGGKDSAVLLHLVRDIYPDIPAVFADTGLEYPEIRAFVKTVSNVAWVKPEMRFDQVIKKYGYPVISKDVAQSLCYARKGSKWALNNIHGLNKDGTPSPYKKAHYSKWGEMLLDAPFPISDECCTVIKEQPIEKWLRQKKKWGFLRANRCAEPQHGCRRAVTSTTKTGSLSPCPFGQSRTYYTTSKSTTYPTARFMETSSPPIRWMDRRYSQKHWTA